MHYRVEALIESDMDEETVAMYAEGVLHTASRFSVEDLSVFTVTHLPSYAELERRHSWQGRNLSS